MKLLTLKIRASDFGSSQWEIIFGNVCQRKNIVWNDIECLEVLYADKKKDKNRNETTFVEKIDTKIKRQRSACADWDYRLMWTLKECVCTNIVTVARRRMAFCNSEGFKESIKEMSLLSFYIFCLFEYNSSVINKTALDYEVDSVIFTQSVLKMRDIGDGFFQLMQNTIEHSEFKEGFFCFRIHDLTDRNYLKKKYGKYVNKYKDRAELFLEMQIADFCTNSVPDKFIQNMKLRMNEAKDLADKKRYISLLQTKEKINLSTFFRPNEEETHFWEEYYKISDNIQLSVRYKFI